MNTKKSQTQGTLCVLLKHILHSRCEEPRPEPHSNDASAPAPRLLPLRSRRPRYISPRRVHRHRARTACSASGLTFVVPRASSNARLHASSSSVIPSVNSMSDCLVPIGPFESSVRVFDSAPPIRPRTIDDIYILSCVTTNTVEHSFILDEKVPVRMSRQVETCAH